MKNFRSQAKLILVILFIIMLINGCEKKPDIALNGTWVLDKIDSFDFERKHDNGYWESFSNNDELICQGTYTTNKGVMIANINIIYTYNQWFTKEQYTNRLKENGLSDELIEISISNMFSTGTAKYLVKDDTLNLTWDNGFIQTFKRKN